MRLKNYKFLQDLEKTREYVFHGSDTLVQELEPRQGYNFGKPDGDPTVFVSQEISIPTFFSLFNPTNNESIRCGVVWCGVDDDFKVSLFASKNILERVGEDQVGYVYVFSKTDFKHHDHHEWVRYEKIKPLHIAEVSRANIGIEITEIK